MIEARTSPVKFACSPCTDPQVSFAYDVEAMPLNRETVVRYFAYLTYPPLYMAGPVITFVEFSEQFGKPRPDMLPWAYAGAWLRLCVFFEALLHVAIKE